MFPILVLLTLTTTTTTTIADESVRECFINQTRKCFPLNCQNDLTPNCLSQKSCKKKQKLENIGNQVNSKIDVWTEYECSWYFHTPNTSNTENKYLYLKMDKFFLNPQFDFIYIFNGTSSNAPLIAALTGEIKNNTVYILKNLYVNPSIYILFKRNSNRQSSFSSFSIEYFMSNEQINQTLFISSKSAEYSTPQLFPNCLNNRIDSTYDYNKDSLNSKRALHSAHLINQTKLYVIGGYSFDFLTMVMNDFYNNDENIDDDFNFIISYDLNNDKISSDFNNYNGNYSAPLKRYSFSSIYDPVSQRIIIYGGLLINSVFNQTKNDKVHSMTVDYIISLDNPAYRHISDEVWSFNLNTKVWNLLNNNLKNTSERMPIAVCGHSSILYKDTMLTFFGFSRFYGFLTLIQEFNLTSNKWLIRNLTNIPVFEELKANFPIGFRHSSVIDEKTSLIYLYGGLIVSESYYEDETPIVSRYLFVYNPELCSMKKLQESRIASFAQSANINADCIYFFGGSLFNSSSGLIRTSKRIRIYNITENVWYNDEEIDKYSNMMTNKDRYGHVSLIFNSNLCIQGGFDGIFLDDIFCINLTCFDSYGNNNSNPITAQLVMNSTSLVFYSDCALYIECYSCQYNPNCFWYQDQCVAASVFQVTIVQTNEVEYFNERKTCKKLCFKEESCMNCTKYSECMWCEHNNICLQKEQFKLIYTFGQCFEYINETNKCKTRDTTLSSLVNKTGDLVLKTDIFACLDYKNCSSCVQQEGCGWCSLDNNSMGYGVCMDAITNLNNDYNSKSYCKEPNWHFDSCPLCECNGHSLCNYNLSQCLECANNTSGNRCEKCADGYFGNSLNNGICNPCQCNSQATLCDPDDGRCFCFTKGVTGTSCSSCEQPRYSGNPSEPNGTCYYDLTIDYQFTFNLNKETDKYYKQIHFSNSPTRFDDEIDLTIKCIKNLDGLFNVTYILWYENDLPQLSSMTPSTTKFYNNSFSQTSSSFHTNEIQLLNAINCTNNEYKYTFTSKDDNHYLLSSLSIANIKNRTFFVYVYNFKTPIIIQISFTHKTRIQLLHFFITFFGCFLTLLAIAFILWKSKQRYDRYRRQRRLLLEMKQMASRPFSKLYIDLDSNDTQNENPIKNKELVMPVAIQPLINNKTAVLTVLLQLPGGSRIIENGQTNDGYENDCFQRSPFVFGSTLVHYDPNELSENVELVDDAENSDKTIIVDIK